MLTGDRVERQTILRHMGPHFNRGGVLEIRYKCERCGHSEAEHVWDRLDHCPVCGREIVGREKA